MVRILNFKYEDVGFEKTFLGNDRKIHILSEIVHQHTGQERDTFTNYDYMHFRFYASSMGRFLKPDNMIPNAFNPQSWNLYSYVNGNTVNFNDPMGHGIGGAMANPAYLVNITAADWINWGVYTSFYSNLYGGDVAVASGGAGRSGSSSQTYTYKVGKWVISGWFDMWITQNEYPYSMIVYGRQPIWSYVSYTVTSEVTISGGGGGVDLTPYKAELDRIDRAYNLWIKQHTGKFADFYHLGGPLSSMAWFFSLGSGGSCTQLSEEAAAFINQMNQNGNMTAEDVEYKGWLLGLFPFIDMPMQKGARGVLSPVPHAVVEIKLYGQTIRTYDPYWRLFYENWMQH